MRKILLLSLALILTLNYAAYANETTDYLTEQGQQPRIIASSSGSSRCNYQFLLHDVAALEWTDGDNIYRVTGHPERLAYLYTQILPLGTWDVCQYIIGNAARVTYGARSDDECTSLDEYKDEFAQAFTQRTAVYPDLPKVTPIPKEEEPETSAPKFNYVLNTNTMKFHEPSCSEVDRINPENRKDVTATRAEVIDQGFEACQKCDP